MTAQPSSPSEPDLPQSEEQRLALRRIAQKLKKLREELDTLNRPHEEKDRRHAP